jgi:hypothetical protein
LVVGNPCNTNALIAMTSAPDIPNDQFFAMTRLDENRAKTQLAQKAGVPVAQVTELCVWGNHSPTMYPDFENAKVNRNKATSVILDESWLRDTFVPTVGQRGKAIIEARGASSAASAAASTAASASVAAWCAAIVRGSDGEPTDNEKRAAAAHDDAPHAAEPSRANGEAYPRGISYTRGVPAPPPSPQPPALALVDGTAPLRGLDMAIPAGLRASRVPSAPAPTAALEAGASWPRGVVAAEASGWRGDASSEPPIGHPIGSAPAGLCNVETPGLSPRRLGLCSRAPLCAAARPVGRVSRVELSPPALVVLIRGGRAAVPPSNSLARSRGSTPSPSPDMLDLRELPPATDDPPPPARLSNAPPGRGLPAMEGVRDELRERGAASAPGV